MSDRIWVLVIAAVVLGAATDSVALDAALARRPTAAQRRNARPGRLARGFGAGRGAARPPESSARHPPRRRARGLPPRDALPGGDSGEAEALFSQSLAAAYLPDTGEVLALPLSAPGTVATASANAGTSRRGGPRRGHASRVRRRDRACALPRAARRSPRFLVMTPAVATRPVPSTPPSLSRSTARQQSGLCSRKGSRATRGQLAALVERPGVHLRGERVRQALGERVRGRDPRRRTRLPLTCTSPYPANLNSWMWDGRCNSIQGAAQAWLDFWVLAAVSSGHAGAGRVLPGQHQPLLRLRLHRHHLDVVARHLQPQAVVLDRRPDAAPLHRAQLRG